MKCVVSCERSPVVGSVKKIPVAVEPTIVAPIAVDEAKDEVATIPLAEEVAMTQFPGVQVA